jgi:hypothetical protein
MKEYRNLYCGGRYDPFAQLKAGQTHDRIEEIKESLAAWQALEEGAPMYHLKDRAVSILNDDLMWCNRHLENLEREENWNQKASAKVGFVARLTNWLWKK